MCNALLISSQSCLLIMVSLYKYLIIILRLILKSKPGLGILKKREYLQMYNMPIKSE